MELPSVSTDEHEQSIHIACATRNHCRNPLERCPVLFADFDIRIEPYPFPARCGHVCGIEHETSKAVRQVRAVSHPVERRLGSCEPVGIQTCESR